MLATNASSDARHDYAAALTDSCPDVSLIDGRRREKELGIQRMRDRDVLLWYASASDPKTSRFFGYPSEEPSMASEAEIQRLPSSQ
jgi:hypothetical protein